MDDAPDRGETGGSEARDVWNPGQYHRFQAERAQPFEDLLGLVRPTASSRVADLGCGTGELTLRLHRELAARETTGVDSSSAMLERARATSIPGLRFVHAHIEDWLAESGESQDVIVSNAALQWCEGHDELFARLAARLSPRGQLAVQMPANHDHPTHTLAAALALESPFVELLGGHVRHSPVQSPERYAALMHRLGFREQHVRLQVYGHVLDSAAEVVEWVKGTLLTDYQKRLPESAFEEFLRRYREAVLAALGSERPHFYPFKRLLLWARF